MGRRQFLQDLALAGRECPPPSISNVHSPDDAVVAFTFSHVQDASHVCEIRLLAINLEDYPQDNQYMLYTEDEHVDPVIPKSFEHIAPCLRGLPISAALSKISTALTDSLANGLATNSIDISTPTKNKSDNENENEDEDEDENDFEDAFSENEDSDNEDFGLSDVDDDMEDAPPAGRQMTVASSARPGSQPSPVCVAKVKKDLRAAKKAGFRVGVIGDLLTSGIVTVSIRVTKLGLSEEAMQAWSLQRTHYLVLLIHFRDGYRDLQKVVSASSPTSRTQIRVGLCQSYKPSGHDAFGAFRASAPTEGAPDNSVPTIEPLFIGAPLNELFRERFWSVVKLRQSYGFNWRSAEAMAHDIQGNISGGGDILRDRYELPDDGSNRALPAIVRDDALQGKALKDVSLPLVAMQFLLRHFVRCTEFCLVCHCQMETTFEALKPYVCSKPLCLYQYMSLGFGPTIEWEIRSQPYVVDLLVSFCYAAARSRRLSEFPVGIGLKAALLPPQHGCEGIANSNDKTPFSSSFMADLNLETNQMTFSADQSEEVKGFSIGNWLVARGDMWDVKYHYQIQEMAFPTWQLSKPFITGPPVSTRDQLIFPVECYAYDAKFDDMTKEQQNEAIITLLDSLPSIPDLRKHFQESYHNHHGGKEGSKLTASMTSISQPALSLLRWIIASNRSCIMQVDQLVEQNGKAAPGPESRLTTSVKPESRVSGMEGWIQFRFAQGAPDKEQRFLDCVEKETAGAKYPTLFAWHGSPLSNWHSIIREGLQLKEILNSRAYGNGIYMSSYAATSLGYTNRLHDPPGGQSAKWPQSMLGVTAAMSLQEVVNKTDAFVSKSPHYVVANTDWIQTRYLLVKSAARRPSVSPALEAVYEQDPKHQCFDVSARSVQIPMTAISKSRRMVGDQPAVDGDEMLIELETEQDIASVASDLDHGGFLESEDECEDEKTNDDKDDKDVDMNECSPDNGSEAASTSLSRKRKLDTTQTDFVPGALDVSKIRFLDPPADASVSATRALQRALKEALKIQDETALSSLGWYINPDHVSNLYQWIVELHSFNEELPLAKDMSKAGITSIVLEMRFTNQFPFSPPFIRVVKPRFLPFSAGGGGHVTEGGAICMELLTNTGWSAVTSIEMVLLQVQLAMSDQDRPARLANTSGSSMANSRANSRASASTSTNTSTSTMHDQGLWVSSRGDSYGVGEAVSAYERACRAHGWKIPDGFSKFAQQ